MRSCPRPPRRTSSPLPPYRSSGFAKAAAPEKGRALYRHFVEAVRALGIQAATGRFGAMMAVSLVNHGPVTLIVESR